MAAIFVRSLSALLATTSPSSNGGFGWELVQQLRDGRKTLR
jgi:hypothetical protein